MYTGLTFFQSIKKEVIEEAGTEPLARLNRLKKDIANGRISGSTYSGYAAEKVDAVTSGQVTSLDTKIDSEEIYSSWIGQGFAIGFKGGLFLIDNEDLCWRIFLGWPIYRKHQKQIPNLKPRQIETWNGHWLFYGSKCKDFERINDKSFHLDIDTTGIIAIPTLSWFKVTLALTHIYGGNSLIANAFVFSKVNSTYGYINLLLPQVRKFYELREKLFLSEEEANLTEEQIEELATYYTFKDACLQGTIGLKALEPAKLRKYMPKGSVQYAQGKDFKFSNEESYKQYQLFKIWIIAMINKTELLKAAENIAEILVETEQKQEQVGGRGKTKSTQASKAFLEIKHLKGFVEGLALLLEKSENKEKLKECLNEVLKMPSDTFPLFMSLIKFEYSYKTK
jgi:hypothetical protein